MTAIDFFISYLVGSVIWMAIISERKDAPIPSFEAIATRVFFWPYFSLVSLLRGFCKGWIELHPDWHGPRLPLGFKCILGFLLGMGAGGVIISVVIGLLKWVQ